MSILRSVTCILWFGFTLMMVPRVQSTVAQNQGEIIDCEKPLDYQIRHFQPKGGPSKLQSALKYSQKPLWPLQWQMTEEILEVDGRSYFPSMKVAEMHKADVKGKEVGVVIIGNTPVNCLHVSIRSRCHMDDKATSWSVKTRQSIFTVLKQMLISSAPDTISSEVAGIIGMSDNDETGGVGIAPACHIGYAVINRSSKSGSPEYCAAKIISRNTSPSVEVFVHSWNLHKHDYIRSVLHASDLSLLNFNNPQAVLKPHVMGSGMYGILANSCQCNEYANADSMFVFGSITYDGYLVPTSETCASLFGVTHSTSYGHYFYNNIVTINSIDSTSYACASKSETALSAAVAGGTVALIIDFFKKKFKKPPSVSDLAFLLAFSLSSEMLQNKNILWFSNGAGLVYSQQAGFGLPNMLNVAQLLSNWTPMEFPIIYEVTRFTREIEFRCGHDRGRRTLTYSSNLLCHFSISNAQARLHIQLVSVELSAELVKRGALSLYLISPAGTVSCMLEGRPYDTAKKRYNKLLLRSNHFIGEQLGGQWSLRFYTYQENSKPAGSDEASAPAENGGKQPFDRTKPALGEKNGSNLSAKISSSNSGGVEQSSAPSDGKLSNLKGNQLRPKKRVTFDEVVTVWDGITKPHKFRGIFREPKTGSTITKDLSSQSTPVPLAFPKTPENKNREPNLVNLNQIKFRFVLHESLPSNLDVEVQVKSANEREKNFELLKAWVDFRHFLFAQLDPQKGAKLRLGHRSIYSIQSKHVKTLASLQKNSKFQSVFSKSSAHLNTLLDLP